MSGSFLSNLVSFITSSKKIEVQSNLQKNSPHRFKNEPHFDRKYDLQRGDLAKLKSGTVLKATDKFNNSIVFEFKCIRYNAIYFLNGNFLILKNRKPKSFNEKDNIAIRWSQVKSIDVVEGEIRNKFYDTLKTIKESNKEKNVSNNNPKKEIKTPVLSTQELNKHKGDILYTELKKLNAAFLFKFDSFDDNKQIITHIHYNLSNCIFTKNKNIDFTLLIDSIESLRIANQYEKTIFQEQLKLNEEKKNFVKTFEEIENIDLNLGSLVYLRLKNFQVYIFHWGGCIDKEIYALGPIIYTKHTNNNNNNVEVDVFYDQKKQENKKNIIYTNITSLLNNLEIFEIRKASEYEIQFYEKHLCDLLSEEYTAEDVSSTPYNQTFSGILNNGNYVKFVLAEAYCFHTKEDQNETDLKIIPRIPYKIIYPNNTLWTSECGKIKDKSRNVFYYKDFKKIWLSSKAEDYFFKEEYKKYCNLPIKHCWNITDFNLIESNIQSNRIVIFSDENKQLKPFVTKVLVAVDKHNPLVPAIFGCIVKQKSNKRYVVVGGNEYKYCFPYKSNQQLIGRSLDDIIGT